MDQKKAFKVGDRVRRQIELSVPRGEKPTYRRGEVTAVRFVEQYSSSHNIYSVKWDDETVGEGYLFLEEEPLVVPTACTL